MVVFDAKFSLIGGLIPIPLIPGESDQLGRSVITSRVLSISVLLWRLVTMASS